MARTERELSDVQWAKLAPLLPPQRPRMGRPPKDHRLIVEAFVWLDRTGVPWRYLPGEFGSWATVASRFYRWRRQGVWDRALQALQADADARGELTGCCSSSMAVWCGLTSTLPGPGGGRLRPTWRRKARGALADPDQQGDREREALGRSRGGYSTKLHLRVEGGGKPMVILATAGQHHEAPMLRPLMEAGAVRRPRGRPRIRPGRGLRRQGLQLPQPAALPAPPRHPGGDPEQVEPAPPARLRPGRLPRAHRVERTINRLKQWRRVATRYEKREANYLTMVTIAAIALLWLE